MDYKEKYEYGLECIQEILSGAGDSIRTSILRKKRLEPFFPELKESDDEKTRMEIRNFIWNYPDKLKERDRWLAWLEKQGEQKPTDKTKPKFKVGDWITDGFLHCKISNVLDDRYIVDTKFAKRSSIFFKCENNYHLWTIKDAKEGDVLVVPSIEDSEHFEQIFIFKEIKDRKYVKNAVEYYCRVCDNKFCVNERGFMGQSDDDNVLLSINLRYIPIGITITDFIENIIQTGIVIIDKKE